MNATQQKFKQILFSTEMVQAILAGRKTQTRRVIRTQPNKNDDVFPILKPDWDGKQDYPLTLYYFDIDTERKHPNYEFQLPLCQPGDILWVRETCGSTAIGNMYKASVCSPDVNKPLSGWKPSIHMSKEAARIFLKVTNVRVERLQDISEEDAIDEGIRKCTLDGCEDLWENYNGFMGFHEAKDSFQSLWQSINAKKHPWESNPWVWVYEFERIEKPANWPS